MPGIFFVIGFLVFAGIVPGMTQPPDAPIEPHEFHNSIGTGFDVAWAQFNGLIDVYNEQAVIDYAEAGFTNARIRTHFDATPELLVHIDSIVTHCLRHGITPIVAYESKEAEEDPTRENLAKVVEWWRTFSEYFKDHSHKLAFNLFIEVGHELGSLPHDTLNLWYKHIVPVIRETNPTRMLVFAPRGQYPENLMYLEIPEETGYYYMAEWHDFAGGPTTSTSESSLHKRWTTGTELEREQLGISIEKANAWTAITGKPTWFGAWMAGKLNEENYYTPEMECIFATHVVNVFNQYEFPWSTNAHQHYYEMGPNYWIPERIPLLNAIRGYYLEPERKAHLYENVNFTGTESEIAIGYYDTDFLEKYGFETSPESMKIPYGYVLELFSAPGFSGNMEALQGNITEFIDFQVMSMKYRDIQFTDYAITIDTTTMDTTTVSMPGRYVQAVENTISLGPNPFRSELFISSCDGLDIEAVNLYDITGKHIYRKGVFDQQATLVPGCKNGMYLLEVITSRGRFTELIIKKE